MDNQAFYKWQESVDYNEVYKIKEASQHLLVEKRINHELSIIEQKGSLQNSTLQ